MPTLIPFRRRDRRAAAYVLLLATRWQRRSKLKPWLDPREPERLGNLLQRLVLERPEIVFAIENMVAEMLAQLDQSTAPD